MIKSIINLKSRVERFRALRNYEKKLPEQLQSLYGQNIQYTPTQITIAIRKAGLPVKHRQLAYEMYLSREEIESFYENSRKHPEFGPLPSITLN